MVDNDYSKGARWEDFALNLLTLGQLFNVVVRDRHNHEQEFEKQSESPWGLVLQPHHATMQTGSYRTLNDGINASISFL